MIKQLQNSFFYFSILVFGAIISSQLYLIYAFPSLGPDSGFYLKISYDLAHGLSFFNEINCSYTPLALYLNSIPFYLLEDPGLPLVFSFFLLMYLGIAIVFYKLSFYFNPNKKVNIFFTLLLVCSLLQLEGIHILLEPYVLLFQLTALYFLFRFKSKDRAQIIVGFFVFLAFYSKQYGIFVLPAIAYFNYKESLSFRHFLRKTGLMILGMLLPVFVLVIYFCGVKGVGIIDFLNQLLGVPALKGDELITNLDYSYIGLRNSFKKLYRIFPFVLLLGYFIFGFFKRKIKKETIFTGILLISSLSILNFAFYLHYYQLIVIYIILCILTVHRDFTKFEYLFIALIFLFFMKSSYSEYRKTFNYKEGLYIEQKKSLKQLEPYLKKGDLVYLEGISPAYYFLAKYKSPNLKTLGYKFPSELTLRKIDNELPQGSFIVLSQEFRNNVIFKDYRIIQKLELIAGKVLILEKINSSNE